MVTVINVFSEDLDKKPLKEGGGVGVAAGRRLSKFA